MAFLIRKKWQHAMSLNRPAIVSLAPFAIVVRALLPLLAVAACATQVETIQFRSAKEQACHQRASAELQPGQTLERARSTGDFVIVDKEQGSVRDLDRSETFDRCMADPGPARTAVNQTAAINLTPEEEKIWATLSDDQKRDALAFIQDGGTLSQYLNR